MPNHQVLDNITHKDIRVITEHHPKFGDTESYSNLSISEFRDAQAHYPIFFRKSNESGQFEAIALFGFAVEENLYLDDSGWNTNYVPFSVQRRPFLIGFQQRNELGVLTQEPVVHIDMDSPRITKESSQGQAIFLEQGGQSDYLQHVSSVLKAIMDGHTETKGFIDCLLEHDLIESVTIKVQLNDASNHELGSLYTINEQKLADLAPEPLVEFHRKGYLQGIYMILASMSNMTHLIDLKNKQL